MGSPAILFESDAPQRQLAIDPSLSVIVQAPAGSGKTELLIQRYLALLARVQKPEAIVAITFTRKAAGEMLDRILGALTRAALGEQTEGSESPAKEHEQRTLELARAALARDRELEWGILLNPNRLRVQTIDSLSSSIAAQAPWLARLGFLPGVEENATPFYREAARRTVESVEKDTPHREAVSTLLAHLDNNAARVRDMIASMLATRDQWLHIAVQTDEDERSRLEASMARALTDGLEAADRLVPLHVRASWASLARYAAANLDGSLDSSEHFDDPESSGWPPVSPVRRSAWLGLANLVLKDDGKWRKPGGLNKTCGFPADGSPRKKQCAALLDRLQEIEGLEDALKFIRVLPPPGYTDAQWKVMRALLECLKLAEAQLRLVFREEGAVDFAQIGMSASEALGRAEDPSDLAFRLDSQIEHLLIDEFQDTSRRQFELLEKLVTGWEPGDGRTWFVVGDPMQSIYRFRQAEVGLFLEAQQRGIGGIPLTPLRLTANYRSTPGVVGRVNQIFSTIFPAANDPAAGAIEYSPSYSANSDANEAITDASDVEPSVTIHSFVRGEDHLEAETVVDLVKQARREDPSGTVAILVRARTHLPAIVEELKKSGLGFRAVDIDPLGERSIVLDLLSLTRAMLHTADRISWFAILRAPWCGLTLNDLASLAEGKKELSVWDLLQDLPETGELSGPSALPSNFPPDDSSAIEQPPQLSLFEPSPPLPTPKPASSTRLSADGLRRAIALRSVLAEAFEQRGRWPLRQWIERAWTNLGGPACLESEADLQDAAAYFDRLEEEQLGYDLPDFDGFRDRLSLLYAKPNPGHLSDPAHLREKPDPQPDRENWLQIMTIHKAKGLEFDTVILPGLGRSARPEETRLFRFHQWRDSRRGGGWHGEDHETQLLLAPVQETGSDPDPVYQYLKTLDSAKDRFERARQLYVASTRAKKRLHLLAHVAVTKDHAPRVDNRSMLCDLWPALSPAELERFSERAAGAPVDLAQPSIPPSRFRRLPLGWAAPPMPSPVAWRPDAQSPAEIHEPRFEWVGDNLRLAGTVVHAFLQRMASADRLFPEPPSLRAALLHAGVSPIELEWVTQICRDALERTLNDERGRWILDTHTDSRSEFAVTGVVDGQVVAGKVDRTFVDSEGTRWVIDYKTSSHEGGGLGEFLDEQQRRYHDQMARYARLLAPLGQPVRLGLYFPLLNAWREWSPTGSSSDTAAADHAR